MRNLILRYLAWNAAGVAAGFGYFRARSYITTACWFVLYWLGIVIDETEVITLAKLEAQDANE